MPLRAHFRLGLLTARRSSAACAARHASSTGPDSSAGAPGAIEGALRRLQRLEAAVEQLTRGAAAGSRPERQRQQQQEQEQPQPQPQRDAKEQQSLAGQAADAAADRLEDAAAQGVTRLHPALIKFLNSGYLVSQRELRQRLMLSEWEETVQPWALAKGLAAFEERIAGEPDSLGVTVQVMQELYQRPGDLSPLDSNPRARLLAEALLQRTLAEQRWETYKACSDTAKQLANVIESGKRTGASSLLSAAKRLLPLPFLK